MSTEPAADSDVTSGPLTGLLVADFSRVLAGPLTTMWLADLGATVIKVERAGAGDETRNWGPPWAGETSSYFTAANRSKLSITVDFADGDDLAVARELASRADVFVENFRTGVLAKFGLDQPTLAHANPRQIYASITGFGSGAGADLAGYDFVVQAVGGLMSITGEADGDPHKAGVALVDVLTAKDAVIGILAALQARDRTGRGQHVEVNLLSTLLASLANQASSFLTTGTAPGRMGNQHPSIAPYETLHCRSSSLLAVACGNDGQFRRLAEVLDLPGVADDPRFVSNSARVAHRVELVAVLEDRLSSREAAEWEELLARAGVPAGQVGTVADGFARAETFGLRPTVDVPGDTPPQVRHPIDYSRSQLRPPTAPPELGADDQKVRDWLASGADLAALEDA
ncbi:MAG TPA: CaiB/BaiF CoA-transferase family protein [Flexivirga sp.]|uniref:CaiB/BaiF CoA transferase family protein n=1 Tax=Flexivirga sp. TaxID=1962927 RepID=UPI002CFA27A1|nr:CaiB/BaiF CoA-transferase family protein [Flexivirga sp.]HWC23868.1 CaiB/BaiF CoA-transferase family protein [Flexivirga sp.]